MIKKAGIYNVEEIAKLAVLMWKEHTVQDLMDEFSDIITEGNAQFFFEI